MSSPVYLPADEFGGTSPPDLDLAADYLELKAALSPVGQSYSAEIVKALEMPADGEYEDVNEEIETREAVATGAVTRIGFRQRVLGKAYPFATDESGSTVCFLADTPDLGQAAYLVSLILSNLSTITPLLGGSELHPSKNEVKALREYFQYFATAALAAEVRGPAWSFGFPRPDRSGFLAKLTEIWSVLKDGAVNPNPSAPVSPKDDKVDVFAWREHTDGLPGFLLAVAQVATGGDWKEKSIKSQVKEVFPKRWFGPVPVTEWVAYHVVPFARPDDKFRDDVLVLGNVLHRIRVPKRVAEAETLKGQGIAIEAFDQLQAAADWVTSYLKKAKGQA